MSSKARQLGEYSEVVPWISTAVGYSKSLFVTDTALYPPTDNDLFRYVILTEGLDGAGQYNDGLLINETITGTGVERQVTAEISLAGSPLNGAVVHLINSERSHLRPGETAGVFEQDQMQRIEGTFRDRNASGAGSDLGIFDSPQGAFFAVNNKTSRPNFGESSGGAVGTVGFDSGRSSSARTSTETDGETRVKSVSQIIFLRIA